MIIFCTIRVVCYQKFPCNKAVWRFSRKCIAVKFKHSVVIIYGFFKIKSEGERSYSRSGIKIFYSLKKRKKKIWCGTHTTFSYLALQKKNILLSVLHPAKKVFEHLR